MIGCAEYCLRVVGLLWAVLGVPGAPSGRVWPVGSGGVASRGCIHTSKIVSRKVHPSLVRFLAHFLLGIGEKSHYLRAKTDLLWGAFAAYLWPVEKGLSGLAHH